MKKRLTITVIVFLVAASLSWADDFPIQFSSIDTELKNDYAVNALGDYYVTGLGLGVQAGFDITPIENLGFFGAIDYNYGISKTIWVDSFQDISLIAGISYMLKPDGPVAFVPEIGYGICVHLLPGDIDRDGTDSTSFYFDQMLTLSIKGIYTFNEVLSVYISPEVKFYLESGSSAILAGYDLGARINL
ncbi:MAG: hypothetical protein JEZ04_13595 [Spirochaetales bacterium]|nr:hypothetical protein [Spirochaetales bacterium]